MQVKAAQKPAVWHGMYRLFQERKVWNGIKSIYFSDCAIFIVLSCFTYMQKIIRPLKLDFVFSVTWPHYENCASFDNQNSKKNFIIYLNLYFTIFFN